MRTFTVQTFEQWRTVARQLLLSQTPPEEVSFHDRPEQRGLFDAATDVPAVTTIPVQQPVGPKVPPEFLELARAVACHRAEDRFQWLYQALWRLTSSEPHLLAVITDDTVYRLRRMEQAVHRDAHKMKAFVRFRKLVNEDGEQFVAWHRPDHRIVRMVAPFFARRFPTMSWAILTPDESVAWDQNSLSYGPGHPRRDAPHADALEDLWKTYYASIFNPARIKIGSMLREMPRRHWATLPETDIIADLLNEAPQRVEQLIARQEGHRRSAADHLPNDLTLAALRAAAAHCQGCDLFRDATQTVFGEGPNDAKVMFVGEQPGDQEDLAGHPFVGPAGQLLNELLAEAGIDRSEAYVTNTVKHFKSVPRGKHRLHAKPNAREVYACRPWLEAEIHAIEPQALVLLGATAAQAILGPQFRIQRDRGQPQQSPWSNWTIATYHPSAILRARDAEHALHIREALLTDLKLVAAQLKLT